MSNTTDITTQDRTLDFDWSDEDRRLLAATALTGDAKTLRRVLNQMLGKVIGKISTDKKTAAARQNGKRGGRPKKAEPEPTAQVTEAPK